MGRLEKPDNQGSKTNKWTVEYTVTAVKELKKLDKPQQKIILAWVEKNLINCENPRAKGIALVGAEHLWRYRIGTYRLICNLDDQTVTVLVLNVKRRSVAYKKKK